MSVTALYATCAKNKNIKRLWNEYLNNLDNLQRNSKVTEETYLRFIIVSWLQHNAVLRCLLRLIFSITLLKYKYVIKRYSILMVYFYYYAFVEYPQQLCYEEGFSYITKENGGTRQTQWQYRFTKYVSIPRIL